MYIVPFTSIFPSWLHAAQSLMKPLILATFNNFHFPTCLHWSMQFKTYTKNTFNYTYTILWLTTVAATCSKVLKGCMVTKRGNSKSTMGFAHGKQSRFDCQKAHNINHMWGRTWVGFLGITAVMPSTKLGPSPSHPGFYRWYCFHSQSWVVYCIVFPTLVHINLSKPWVTWVKMLYFPMKPWFLWDGTL